MLRKMLLPGCLILLLLTARVAAQVEDPARPPVAHAGHGTELDPLATYSLSWWTVDTGGASSALTGGHMLGGTAGQADAALPRSDKGYELRAGFWLPSCAAEAVVASITKSGGAVTLAWPHNDMNQAYQVHRATSPYFTPARATRQALIESEPWRYTDFEADTGDPNPNYFYLVRATCGAAYADASRHGEFDFALVAGMP